MQTYPSFSGLIRCRENCFIVLAAFGLVFPSLAAVPARTPVPLRREALSPPTKLALTATARPVNNGATVDLEVSLRDAQNRPVPAPRDLKIQIEALELSGTQRVPVTIKAGTASGQSIFPLQEGGLIELRASHPELRSATTFVRLKPFAAPAQPVAGFMPGTATGGSPGTHLGKEAAKINQTADSITQAGRSIHDAAKMFSGWLGLGKSGQPGILVGSQEYPYLADGQDAAIIKVFLPAPASKKTEIHLTASAGKLDPAIIVIDKDQDTGQTRLTSDKIGTIEVKCASITPKSKLMPTNSQTFHFKPPITRLAVGASPPVITLLDSAELHIQLQNTNGLPEKTDEPRRISLLIVSGRAEIPLGTNVISAGDYETRIAFQPVRWGKVGIKAFTDGLPADQIEVQVNLPSLLLSVSAFGGCLGGLLAAFHAGLPARVRNGSWKGRLKHLPWWRMAVGLVTGFVLYWAFIFLSFSTLPKAAILNPFSTLVFSLLGGWMGLSVFSLLLKRLHLVKADAPASMHKPEMAKI